MSIIQNKNEKDESEEKKQRKKLEKKMFTEHVFVYFQAL